MITDPFSDLPATVADLSFVSADTLQLRLELGRVLDSAATADLPDGVGPDRAGEWIVRDGAVLGRVSGTGETFQGTDTLVRSPLSDDVDGFTDPARWSATVNGEPVAVTLVSAKSNVLDSARTGQFVTSYEFATLENVFVTLDRDVASGDDVTLRFDAPDFAPITATAGAGTVSEAIHVNLAGFETVSTSKTAYLSSWNGVDADGVERPQAYAPGAQWSVVDEATGGAVLSGTIALDKPASETDRGVNFARADVWEIDFSALDQAGTYHVVVEDVGRSRSFAVGDGVLDDAFVTAARGFYHQRSGTALEEPWTDWERPASFPEGTAIQRTTIRISDTNEGYDGSDPNPKPLFAAATTGEVLLDVSGGWHDAGDWDRRTQHLEAARRLMELVELEPEFAEAVGASIPESGNALPDLLDEALWGMKAFRELQDADGGVSGGIQSAGDPLYGEGSWSESQGVYAYAPDPWTTWEYAATAAKAAFVLRAYDPALAEEYRESALRAMEWAEARTGEAELGRPIVLEARNVAAAELFRLTGDERWNDVYLDTTSYTQSVAQIDFTEHQWEAAFVYARTERPGVDEAVAATGIADLADEARTLTDVYRDAAFGQTYNPFAPYGFGKSFSQPSDAANLFVRLHAATGEASYLALAEEAVQFALGANPLNMSFMTGLEGPDGPVRDPEELLVVDADTLGRDPPPGIVAYGTYDARQYGGFYKRVMDEAVRPGFTDRPVLESFDAYFFNIPATEFTVQQGMAELTYTLGYLAAQSGVPEPAPAPEPAPEPVTIDLDNGIARNVIEPGGRDLVLRNFDVDGGGENTFDALLVDGQTFSTEADLLALVSTLAAGEGTSASREGSDLRLDLGSGSVVLAGVIGNGLSAPDVDAALLPPSPAPADPVEPTARPSVRVDLDNGIARNTVELADADLVIGGFDVDGGGERTFDTLVAGGGSYSTAADFLDLVAMLEAGSGTDASRAGTDLTLDFGIGTVTLEGVIGSDLNGTELDTVLL